MIVGHSTAGLIVPGVVTKLGSARVREMILAAAFAPPHGTALVDTFPGLLGWYARRESVSKARKGKAATMPTVWATFTFCNGMTRAQRSFVRERLYPDSPTVVLESVDRSASPRASPAHGYSPAETVPSQSRLKTSASPPWAEFSPSSR